MKKILFPYLLSIILILTLPETIAACPLCQGSGTKDTDFAYKGITLFLALLPIIGAWGIFYWIRLQNKK